MADEKSTNELKEVTKELTGWDNKIFTTLKHLTIKPGQMVTDYCSGKKDGYLSPVVYYFGVTALETYVVTKIGLLDALMKDVQDSMKEAAPTGIPDKVIDTLSFLNSEIGQKIFYLPILLLATWFVYKRFNRSFAQNSWFTLFILGHTTLLTMPLMLYWYFFRELDSYTYIVLAFQISYWVWASRIFFNLSIGKAILLKLLNLILAMLIISISGIAITMIYFQFFS